MSSAPTVTHPRASAGGSRLARLREGGMALVLLILAVVFSALTIREAPLTGDAAAADVAERGVKAAGGKAVVIVARPTADGRAFAEAVTRRLAALGVKPAETVVGEPRDLKAALRRLADAGTGPEAALTLEENLTWQPLKGVPTVIVPGVGRWPVFLTRQNLLNVANQIVVVAILSVGLTFVILTGGIDLSVGSLIALAAVVGSRLVRDHFGGGAATGPQLVLAAVCALSLCGGVGCASGAVVVAFSLPPFIATLAVMQAASGLAFILSRGESIYDLPDAATWLGRAAGLFGVPYAVLLMLVVYAAAHVLLTRTVLGRQLYAVGGNETAARFSGVPVGRAKLFAYGASGALAGLGGVVLTSQLKSGAPTYGLSYELYAIAAVVVGGASLNGGRGSMLGTMIGALIIAVLQNGMNLIGVESYAQKLVLGLVILGSVLFDHLGRSLRLR